MDYLNIGVLKKSLFMTRSKYINSILNGANPKVPMEVTDSKVPRSMSKQILMFYIKVVNPGLVARLTVT